MCNNYGRELLDLCKASNLRMTNGRFGEDRGIGSFTCFTSRGQSTVDYHILSESLLGRIKNFVVEPPSDISDHCPLITTLYESSYSTHEFVKLRNSSSFFLEDIMLRETPGYIDQPPSPPTKYSWTSESEKEVTAMFTSLDNLLPIFHQESNPIPWTKIFPNSLTYYRQSYQNVPPSFQRGNGNQTSSPKMPGLTVSAKS